jgi:hypothetical protein
MTSIITGDIINSQKVNAKLWIEPLKNVLSTLGISPTNWEIFRGDCFQIEIEEMRNTFIAFLKIKNEICRIQNLDVRIGIGIGSKTYQADKITESNGKAFVYSGECFDALRKSNLKLAIKSENETINENLNLLFKLGINIIDRWTPSAHEVCDLMIEYPTMNQEELGRMLRINQNAVSKRINRANIYEILEINAYFEKQIKKLAE